MNQGSRLSLDRWTEKYHVSIAVAIQAHQAAMIADQAYGIMEALRAGWIDDRLPARPGMGIWLALYRDHRRVCRALGDNLPNPFGSGRRLEERGDLLRMVLRQMERRPELVGESWSAMTKQQRQRLVSRGQRVAQRLYRRHLRELEVALSGEDEESEEDLGELIGQVPEIHFFFRVVLPCFLSYESGPIELLRQARSGDPGAMEKLLRLDPEALHDPRIGAWVHEAEGSVRGGRLDMVAHWMEEGLSGPFSRRALKCSLGGLIARFSETVGRRLTARQIRDLFDALARDRAAAEGESVLIDADLADLSLEGFQKAIQRHRRLWRLIPQRGVDKSRPR